MATMLDDTKRQAFATRLADMKALQNLLIANEQKLMPALGSDEDIQERLEDMLEDDQGNIKVIDSVIAKFGAAQPQEKIQKLIEAVQGLMEGNELTLYEKIFEHEKLKHQQAMTGLFVHKAAQVVGDDLGDAIGPINKVNFENRAHQEQLKGVLEILSTRELVGKDPDQGVWGRVQDAVSALRGVFGSIAS